MAHAISLHTSNAQVRELVGPWLAESRVQLDRPAALHIEVGPLPDLPRDDRPPFRQGRVTVHTTHAGYPPVLRWEPALGVATLDDASVTAHVVISDEGLARPGELVRSFLLNVCILLLRRVGLHHVHGATLRDPDGRGWLLVGVSGSGKSTTTALLARSGWDVGTDDIAFLTRGAESPATEVVAWRERLALRDDAVLAGGYAGGTAFAARRKTGWYPEELSTAWVERVRPALVVFPRVAGQEESSAVPIRAADALSRLMRCSPWVALEPALADDHLALMTALVTGARAYDLALGRDLFATPDRLLELVA